MPCVPKTCGTSQNLIAATNVTENETSTLIECVDPIFYLEGSEVLGARNLTAKCLQRPNKLSVWQIEDYPIEKGADVACMDGLICHKPPPKYPNKELLHDFDDEIHPNGTTFGYYCPSLFNESCKILRNINLNYYHGCI